MWIKKYRVLVLQGVLMLMPLLAISQEEEGYFLLSPESDNSGKSKNLYQKELAPRRYSVFKTNPLALIIGQIIYTGELRLGYEYMLTPKQSIQVAASYNFLNVFVKSTFDSLNVTVNNQIGTWGYRLQLSYRYYLYSTQDFKPEGFFVSPHVSINRFRLYERGNYSQYFSEDNFFNVNLLVGYQQILWDRITGEIVLGIGYRNNFIKERLGAGAPLRTYKPQRTAVSTVDQIYYNAFKPTFKIEFGITF